MQPLTYDQLTDYAEKEIRRRFARDNRYGDFRVQDEVRGATYAVLDVWRRLVAPLAESAAPAVCARIAADDYRLDDLVIPF